MNGRVHDPELGRFMSPDIAIQDISKLQVFGAYFRSCRSVGDAGAPKALRK